MTKDILSKYPILLKSILLVIFVMSIGGCAETSQNNTFTAPDTEREQIVKFITPQEAYTLMQGNKNNPYFVVIDDRSPVDFKNGHIADAINIPTANFSADVSKQDRNNIYVIYCPTGCGLTSNRMKQLGFKEVYEIEGGLIAWKAAKLPVEK